MKQAYSHIPVMVSEVLDAMSSTPSLPVIDATLGGAGHATAILRAFKDRRLIGLDQDEVAIEVSRERLFFAQERIQLFHARFDDIVQVAEEAGIYEGGASAVFFDLGVSSYQIDTPDRGFSFQQDGPLDMRMNRTSGLTAEQYIDQATEDELTLLFAEHGEERFARKVAQALIAARPVRSTLALFDLIEATIPVPARRRGHPARRIFQALRVAVNGELDVLSSSIAAAIDLLAPGGRIIVLSYHSGEDRLVKRCLLEAATGGCHCPPGLPCVCGATPGVRLLNRGARMASTEETELNARAKSARLRVAERLRPLRAEAGR